MLVSFVASSSNGGTDNNINTKINWLSFDEAVKQNQSQPKKIFVDLYTDWCTWCLKMEKATFEHPDIVEYINENFYPVKLDAETRSNIIFKNNQYIYRPDAGKRGVHELAIFLTRGRLNYPSVVFLDEGLDNPQPISGFQNPVEMDKLLKFFGEDYYKNLDWGIFKQIYESPLQGRGTVNEHEGYDIQPINASEQKIENDTKGISTSPNTKKQDVKTPKPAAVTTSKPAAVTTPKPVEKNENETPKIKEQEVIKTEKTKISTKEDNKNNRRSRKNKK